MTWSPRWEICYWSDSTGLFWPLTLGATCMDWTAALCSQTWWLQVNEDVRKQILKSFQRQQMFIMFSYVLWAFPRGLQLCSSSSTLQPAAQQRLMWFPSALHGNSRCSKARASLRRYAAVLAPIYASPVWKPGKICTDCRFELVAAEKIIKKQ